MTEQLLATESEISVTEPVNSPYEAGEMCDRAQMPASAVRIGAVSYLNSKPLIEDLSNLLPEAG